MESLSSSHNTPWGRYAVVYNIHIARKSATIGFFSNHSAACQLLILVDRLTGCRADGSVCIKDTPDCIWSIALSQHAITEGRHVWEARVRGRTGRMAIGVAKCVEEVLRPTGAGWISPACEGNVWYYSSTGSLRDGPRLIQETVGRS